MAKQISGRPQIDEDFMKEIISQGVPVRRDVPLTEPPLEEVVTPPEPLKAETVQAEKSIPRKRKNQSGDYRETYFQI